MLTHGGLNGAKMDTFELHAAPMKVRSNPTSSERGVRLLVTSDSDDYCSAIDDGEFLLGKNFAV